MRNDKVQINNKKKTLRKTLSELKTGKLIEMMEILEKHYKMVQQGTEKQ